MFIRAHSVILSAVILFVAGTAGPSLHAQQQSREQQQRPMGLQLNESIEQSLFVDELGLQLTLEKFYEGHLDIDTYRLGTGDLLGISLEGNVTGALRGLRVNSQGTIIIPEIGVINVRGLLLSEAEERINRRVEEKLSDTSVRLYLEHPRTIKIDVVGNIPHAGPQLIIAQTRLDQAIYHSFFQPDADSGKAPIARQPAGAIASTQQLLANKYPVEFIESNEFALRNISINREDGTQLTGDLIRYLRTGDPDANPVIKEGDIIHINRFYDYNPRISISGAVNRPLELEYRPDDSIRRLLGMAGGTTYDAVDELVRIVRITEDGLNETVLDDPASITGFELEPNDRIIIPFDRQKRATHNVQVYGEAQLTGRFPIDDGVTTLYELMELTGGLTEQALTHAAYLIRTQPGKTDYGPFYVDPSDTLDPFIHDQAGKTGYGTRYAFNPTLLTRTSDQYEQGFEYLDLEAQLIQNRVHVDLNDDEQMKSVKLFDGDRLHIPKNEGTVFVFGQVNNPGYYNFNQDWSTDDYISRASGFALSADEERIFIIKSEYNSWYRPDNTVLQPGDLVFVDRVPFDELQAARNYDLQKRSQRNSNIQLVMTGLTTITSIITAYIAVTR